jgi:hypothetical protein
VTPYVFRGPARGVALIGRRFLSHVSPVNSMKPDLGSVITPRSSDYAAWYVPSFRFLKFIA